MRVQFAITAVMLAVSTLSSTAFTPTPIRSHSTDKILERYSFATRAKDVPDVSSIPGLLLEKFPGSHDWTLEESKSNSLEKIYGMETPRIYSGMQSIQQAKTDAGITRKNIGCGPIAIIDQFDLLSTVCGYSLLNPSESRIWGSNSTPLTQPSISSAKYILETAPVHDFGDAGAAMVPTTIANTSNAIMKELGASFVTKGPAGTFEDEDLINSLIYPSMAGPRNMSQAEKEKLIRNEIDLGMPVIWDTIGGGLSIEPYDSHAMNLVGYRTYQGTSASGEALEYTYYDIHMNWSYTKDSIVDPINFTGGIASVMIPFFRIHDSIRIRPRDYGFPCSYNNSPLTSTITDATGRQVKIERLRTGYIKHYDNSSGTDKLDQQFIVLSCNRRDGTSYMRDAYIQYTLPEATDWLRFDLSLWSDNEKLLNTRVDWVNLEILDKSGDWVTVEKLLPQLLLSGTYLREFTHFYIHLESPTTGVRIVAHDASGNSTSNRGRVVLGNFNAVLPL